MRFVSKICSVAPEIFLARLIHKSVFELIELGTPLGEPESTVTDEISQHIYRGGKGVVTYRCDGIRILVEAVYSDRPVLRCALRDRQLDGTSQSSPLTIFPNTDPACNRLPGADFFAAELSIYSWDPNTYLDGLDVEGTVGHFIADPDFYIWRNFEPDLFFRLWEQAFFLGRAPWQTAKPMSNVPAFFVKQATEFLRELGYNRLDAVPSWFNVAAFFEKLGFSFTFGEHALAYAGIVEGLRCFGAQSKLGAKRLTRAQQAWLVALQNIPDCYIGNTLLLPARWPVTHTNMYWVRMHVDLNPYEKGAQTGSSLLSKIKSLRADGETRIVLHAATYCPCTDTLGASSPAATSPQAVMTDSSGDGKSG